MGGLQEEVEGAEGPAYLTLDLGAAVAVEEAEAVEAGELPLRGRMTSARLALEERRGGEGRLS